MFCEQIYSIITDGLCQEQKKCISLSVYRGGNSKARYPKIQNMLRMIDFGENVGTGFPKIILF